MNALAWTIRIGVKGPNAREVWQVRARRVHQERCAVQGSALVQLRPEGLVRLAQLPKPVVVTLTRVGVRLMDDDNLQGALKAIRDEVGVLLGTGDAPSAPVEWVYRQRTGPRPCVEVSVRSASEAAA